MFCKYCGNEISETVKFCPTCGTPVAAEQPKKKKSPAKAIIAIVLVFAVIAGGAGVYFLGRSNGKNSDKAEGTSADTSVTAENTDDKIESEDDNTPEISFSGKNEGDIIKFGSYEQDNDTSNGKEEIEWIVLAKEKDRMLVVSRYALDTQPYNTVDSDVTWETCTLRKWLNEFFLNEAFSSEEQNMIQTATVVNNDNPEYETSGGNDTKDKIFLLSCDEVEKYFSSEEARMCKATSYAEKDGALIEISATWWLRTPGFDSSCACDVVDHGRIDASGHYDSFDRARVRPALYINL